MRLLCGCSFRVKAPKTPTQQRGLHLGSLRSTGQRWRMPARNCTGFTTGRTFMYFNRFEFKDFRALNHIDEQNFWWHWVLKGYIVMRNEVPFCEVLFSPIYLKFNFYCLMSGALPRLTKARRLVSGVLKDLWEDGYSRQVKRKCMGFTSRRSSCLTTEMKNGRLHKLRWTWKQYWGT